MKYLTMIAIVLVTCAIAFYYFSRPSGSTATITIRETPNTTAPQESKNVKLLLKSEAAETPAIPTH